MFIVLMAPVMAISALALYATSALEVSQNDTAIARVREVFMDTINEYMLYAYPRDELNPNTCTGSGLYSLREDGNHHIQSGHRLTLVDSLSSIALISPKDDFYRHVDILIADWHRVHHDNQVLTFEMNIRLLGGLLSAHQMLTHKRSPVRRAHYKGDLLDMAIDLGNRLLPAFNTKTGLPRSLINLKTGKTGDSTSNCPAASGTFLLEFGLLSELSGDSAYIEAAQKATSFLYDKSRYTNWLVGMEVDVESGEWLDPYSVVGAGIDSHYEYMLKYALYSGDQKTYKMWLNALESIKTFLIDDLGFLRIHDLSTDTPLPLTRIDSLAAFLPGLLALHGDLAVAELVWEVYYTLYKRFKKIPEWFDTWSKSGEAPYFLRPEFIESTYYLYRATRKPLYKQLALDYIDDLVDCCKSKCGFSSLYYSNSTALGDSTALGNSSDNKSGKMDSFFMAETLKYLYLILDEQHWIHDAPIIFTTEAHPIFVSEKAGGLRASCARYERDSVFKRHLWEERRLKVAELIYEEVPPGVLEIWD